MFTKRKIYETMTARKDGLIWLGGGMDRRNHVSGQTGITGSNPVLISGRLFILLPFVS